MHVAKGFGRVISKSKDSMAIESNSMSDKETEKINNKREGVRSTYIYTTNNDMTIVKLDFPMG